MGKTTDKYKIESGWMYGARRAPSENFEPRPFGARPELLVIHNISLPPGQFGSDSIERFFQNCLDWDEHPFFDEIRGVRVSAHLLIRRDGEVVQFVSFDDRAWHAGASEYCGRSNCNDFSVGVELEGTDQLPYADAQYSALQEVSAALFAAYPGMGPADIAGHCDIAPGRKTDPGPAFDWSRYRNELSQENSKELNV